MEASQDVCDFACRTDMRLLQLDWIQHCRDAHCLVPWLKILAMLWKRSLAESATTSGEKYIRDVSINWHLEQSDWTAAWLFQHLFPYSLLPPISKQYYHGHLNHFLLGGISVFLSFSLSCSCYHLDVYPSIYVNVKAVDTYSRWMHEFTFSTFFMGL